jgi:hypothetical protein
LKDPLPVYRRDTDGKLIRVPNDIRDPKRRYHRITSPTETYDLEFTDDEEKQRDAEEAKWEVERPQREKESARQREESEKFKNSLIYEDRIVAFLDILGWRSKIKQSVNDPELTKQLGVTLDILEKHAHFVDNTKNMGFPGDPQVTHFSDSIVLSVLKNDATCRQLIIYIQSITRTLLSLGMLVRGGISSGKLVHKGSNVYGPSLNDAYDLEHKEAKSPRIILDRTLAKD